MSKKKISNQEKTTTSPVVNVEPQTPVVVSENPTLEATTNEEPAELSALEKLKLRAKLMVEVANALADRIIEKAIAKEDREAVFKARRDEISTVVKEKAVLSKEQRLERRKLRREANMNKCLTLKHIPNKTIPKGTALEAAKDNQPKLAKKIMKNFDAKVEAKEKYELARKHNKQAITDKLAETRTTKQQRIDAAIARKKSGREEYLACKARHEAAKKETPVDSEIRAKAAEAAEKKRIHDENLGKIRLERMEKRQKHEQYIAKVKAELLARFAVKRKSTVVKNNTNVKYMLACTRLNEKGQPYQFYTTFKTCTEKEALKTLQTLHVKKTASGDASYHSYSLYRPNYMPVDLVKKLENPIKIETKSVDSKTKLAA